MAAKLEVRAERGQARRSYGTGSLFVRTDSGGRETWYGKWRANGRQLKRRIGPTRAAGSSEGFARRQAEAELRRMIHDTPTRPAVRERLTIGELGRRYSQHLRDKGRKQATHRAVELALRVHLVPYFGERSIDSITGADVEGLIDTMRTRGLSAKSIRNYVGTLSGLFNYARRKRLAGAQTRARRSTYLSGRRVRTSDSSRSRRSKRSSRRRSKARIRPLTVRST